MLSKKPKQIEEHLLPINITKVKIKRIVLDYQDDKLVFSVEVGLISDYGIPVTSMYVSNNNYNNTSNAETSLRTISLSKKLREEIKVSVVRFMNRSQKIIGG